MQYTLQNQSIYAAVPVPDNAAEMVHGVEMFIAGMVVGEKEVAEPLVSVVLCHHVFEKDLHTTEYTAIEGECSSSSPFSNRTDVLAEHRLLHTTRFPQQMASWHP